MDGGFFDEFGLGGLRFGEVEAGDLDAVDARIRKRSKSLPTSGLRGAIAPALSEVDQTVSRLDRLSQLVSDARNEENGKELALRIEKPSERHIDAKCTLTFPTTRTLYLTWPYPSPELKRGASPFE
jgi:hypothetical protein